VTFDGIFAFLVFRSLLFGLLGFTLALLLLFLLVRVGYASTHCLLAILILRVRGSDSTGGSCALDVFHGYVSTQNWFFLLRCLHNAKRFLPKH
jgi:hypothetical protein